MKAFSLVVILFILAASVLLAGCTTPVTDSKATEMNMTAKQPNASFTTGHDDLEAGTIGTRYTNLTRFVDNAAAYAKEHGKVATLAAFNDPNGTFVEGDMYIFAYDMNGTTLALPFQPELIGSNRLNFSDTYGVKIIPWEISAAQRGGGFVYVDYLNPDTGAVGLKLCYVAPVDDEWLVGSGIYTGRV